MITVNEPKEEESKDGDVNFMDTMRTEDDHMADDNPFGLDEDETPVNQAELVKATKKEDHKADFVDVLPNG